MNQVVLYHKKAESTTPRPRNRQAPRFPLFSLLFGALRIEHPYGGATPKKIGAVVPEWQ